MLSGGERVSVTAKQAYQIAQKEADGFKITGCCELSDRYLFGWCQSDGTAIMLPPICVLKENGEVDLHDESGGTFLSGSCREQGKDISLEELETV